MRRLLPIDAVPGPGFVDALLRAWDAGDAVLPVDPRLPAPARRRLLDAMRPDDPVEDGDALVVATSGTTGEPKGVVLTHDAVAASARASSARLGVDPEADRWLSALPLAHVGGLAVVLRAVVTGTPLTFDDDAEAATLTSLVATQLGRMDVDRFRRVLLGGAAPPEAVPPNCVVTYGMTETGSGVVYDGIPLDGVEVREIGGELQVRGPMLLRAYRDGRDPRTAHGWFATGDGGRVVDGRVEVHGRLADVVVTGGEKVWPGPVERLLRRLPSVVDVVVRGRPDREWGERVVAFVEPVPGSAPPVLEELREAVKAELPAWCAPKELVVLDRLPRTALGKVRRADLT